jgi:hypothetical protein
MSRRAPDGWIRVDKYALQSDDGQWRISASRNKETWTFSLWQRRTKDWLWVDKYETIEAAVLAAGE